MITDAVYNRRHCGENWRVRRPCESLGGTVAPFDQCRIETCGLGSRKIHQRIPAVKRVSRACAQHGQRQLRCIGGGLAGAPGHTSRDGGEMPRKAQFVENPLAQALRLVRADREADSLSAERRQRLVHSGKGKVRGDRDGTMERPERCDLRLGFSAMGAKYGSYHRLPANRVHLADQVAVGLHRNATLGQHLVNDCSGQPGAVDQRTVEIEDDVSYKHARKSQSRLGSQSAV